jgi:hypothetical protein
VALFHVRESEDSFHQSTECDHSVRLDPKINEGSEFWILEAGRSEVGMDPETRLSQARDKR